MNPMNAAEQNDLARQAPRIASKDTASLNDTLFDLSIKSPNFRIRWSFNASF